MSKLHIALIAALLAIACGKGGGQPETAAPAVPSGVKLHGATETTLTFQWNEVQGASYEWKLTSVESDARTGTVSQRNVTIDKLTPGTAYSFSVQAVNGVGKSGWSAPLEVATAGSKPVPGTFCVDAPLVVEVGSGATLGTSGLIQVFRADGTQVDKIDMADMAKVKVLEDGTMVPAQKYAGGMHTFMDKLHSGDATRTVHYTPVRLKDGKLYIKLHSDVLEFGESYYLTVDESVAGKAVEKDDMPFTTKLPYFTKIAPPITSLQVKPDGSGDFCTVQGALSFASTLGKETEVTIEVGEGTFNELLFLQGKDNVTLRGESREKTVIAYPNSELYMEGSDNRCLFLATDCNNLVLENLTIENTFYAQDHKGQAETLYYNAHTASFRLTVDSCALISWQDTFLCKGEVYVYNSLIAGHCDYIWGYPKACLFEDCEILSRAKGYIVQARVEDASNKGFVFLHCTLTAANDVADGSVYLARSGGDSSVYDNVTYINCSMSGAIAPAGWYTSPAPTPSAPTATSGWKEYGTWGVSTASRNAYGRMLTASEAEAYSSKAAVLGW